jgi:hypothetical protein
MKISIKILAAALTLAAFDASARVIAEPCKEAQLTELLADLKPVKQGGVRIKKGLGDKLRSKLKSALESAVENGTVENCASNKYNSPGIGISGTRTVMWLTFEVGGDQYDVKKTLSTVTDPGYYLYIEKIEETADAAD